LTKLPVVSGKQCVKALAKVGFLFKRQEGSHMVLRREDPFCQVTVPDHKDLDRGTLRGILKQAGISPEEFQRILR